MFVSIGKVVDKNVIVIYDIESLNLVRHLKFIVFDSLIFVSIENLIDTNISYVN